MEREQIIKALECCSKTNCEDCPYTKNGKVDIFDITCSVNMAKDALALIKELTEELEKERTWADSMIDNLRDDIRELTKRNERLKTIPEQLHKEMSERMIEEVKVAKKYTIRRMQSDIKEECLKGGIWPAFVAGVVKGVGEKILEENNV